MPLAAITATPVQVQMSGNSPKTMYPSTVAATISTYAKGAKTGAGANAKARTKK